MTTEHNTQVALIPGTDLPVSPGAAAQEPSLEDLVADLMSLVPAKPLRVAAPKRQHANLKPRRAAPGQALDLSDLLPSRPVNPAYVWRPVAVVFGYITHRCLLCNLVHRVPNPPLVRWARPFGQQQVTTARFPADWQRLPRESVELASATVTGCQVCLMAAPTVFYEAPLGDLSETADPAILGAVPEPIAEPQNGDPLTDILTETDPTAD